MSQIVNPQQRKQHYYKTLDLNINIGSKTMRLLASSYLHKKGIELKDHLKEPQVKKKIDEYSQFQKKPSNNPSLCEMDTSVLTILLLHTFQPQLTQKAKESIIELRQIRNNLAHAYKAELDDNSLFQDSCNYIMKLAHEIQPQRKNYLRDLFEEINDIRLQEIVYNHCNLDRVTLNNEVYVVKLVSATGNERADQTSDLAIKIGLTKWVRQLSRGVHVGEFLQKLKENVVINDTMKRTIEEEYSNEEQMQVLILYMMNETKYNLCKFCESLRQISPPMADLVENSNTDGRDIEQYLKDYEKENVTRILTEHFVERENETLSTESLHIFLEEKYGYEMAFCTVNNYVRTTFPNVRHTAGDCSFAGIFWRRGPIEPVDDETAALSVASLSCEDFAVFVGDWFEEIDHRLKIPSKRAIQKELISAKIFVDMTQEEMKGVFQRYFKDSEIEYGFGIQKGLMQIQSKIRSESVTPDKNNIENLRPFDTPFNRTCYKQCMVRPQQGNLLIPAHEFRYLRKGKPLTKYFVMKEVVQFTAACINGRKNGTIHFGIDYVGNGVGRIIGVPGGNRWNNLNKNIENAIEVCFKEKASTAFKCIGPVHIIPVEGNCIVIEVDVIPFSRYISETILPVDFPPKGNQTQQYFVYSLKPDFGIVPVRDCLYQTEVFYKEVLQERFYLEELNDNKVEKSKPLGMQLRKVLTGANSYVTDSFVPVIISGKISGCQNEPDVRAQLKEMHMAFSSSALIIDCDDSVLLRKDIEGNKRLFHVKTAEDLVDNPTELPESGPTWLYCNGNREVSKKEMEIENWIDFRAEGVGKAFENVKNRIPKSRAKIIFLVFQSGKTENDLLREISRMAFVTYFKNQCAILSQHDEYVSSVKSELVNLIGQQRLENAFHTGLQWKTISRIMRNIFKFNPTIACKLPHCDGHFIEMTKIERESLNFTDIEILSGEECVDCEKHMKPEDIKQLVGKIQEQFYKGHQASWWNFYYKQIGERDQYMIHKNEIQDKLSNSQGEKLIELHKIEHYPGAGGSTIGKHLLWYFSQFRGTPERSYRCCVVKTNVVTKETVKQIETFRNYNDGVCPKPFIVLSDDLSEEDEKDLKDKLHEAAYKTGNPGKLFCLVLTITRRPITYDETGGNHLLKHTLSRQEQVWFEEKFKQMEKSDDVDVDTLLAFNCMRHSFDQGFMQKTVDHLLKGVTEREMEVLLCLALVSSYESACLVPESVFDEKMEAVQVHMRQPWGIAHSHSALQRLATSHNEAWNTKLSRAMTLISIKKTGNDFQSSGVCLISQLLAKIVLEYLQSYKDLTLENIVDHVLDLAEKHTSESNQMSKRFVKIICSLFKTRQLLDGEGQEQKQKFSDLVLTLDLPDTSESEIDAHQRVLRVMSRCFKVTKDPLVGQQFARFNIHIKEFEAAEVAIKQSLQIQSLNSYLLHTYGQIYRTKMEDALFNSTQSKTKIRDSGAADIIDFAFQAIDKFVEGQRIAITTGDNTNWGCFNTEVKTALSLLEKFQHFACYTDRQTFVSFLNEDIRKVAEGPLLRLMGKFPALENLRAGSSMQCHLETSLRSMEERRYQVKRQLYVIDSQDDTLLLGLRERFERFYGSLNCTSKYQFSFGIGLKPLMVAKERNKEALCRRVMEAKENIEKGIPQPLDERDLLVYLGDKIISISRATPSTDPVCSNEEYKRLLSYSNKLVALQTQAPASKRLYLETFLYYAMLHWPLKCRTTVDSDAILGAAAYEQIMKKWEDAYNSNFYIKTREQFQKYRPKNYFALGKGTPGNDIVDLESIKRDWMDRKKKATGRVRKPVFRDFFWRETFVEERLERLKGVVDDSGNNISHEAEYENGFHKFRIKTYYPCQDLSNRLVTFVLGFTWKEPTAFDVLEIGENRTSLEDANNPAAAAGNSDERTLQAVGDDSTEKSKPRRRRRKHKR